MYALIWKSKYSKSNYYELRVHETIEQALDDAEYQRLERRNYGKTWWVTEPMERRESFVGAFGTHRVIFSEVEEQTEEQEDQEDQEE